MKKETIIGLFVASILCISLAIYSVIIDEKQHSYQRQQIEQRDAFIQEYLDSLYVLKDEFVLTPSNEKTIHALDSLGLEFATKTGKLNYYKYALDINYLQEKLHN